LVEKCLGFVFLIFLFTSTTKGQYERV